MEPIIEIKNLDKQYKITHSRGRYVTLRDVIINIFKNPFSFLKDKTKTIIGLNKKENYWALNNVNININKGEVVGIIGRNGAGKSTLLKILSQITPPTKGEIRIKGSVGSLLEVGTGFHPELTGRENIFLNGAILGMKKGEIENKFDKIVEFAGIEKFLDTPVKYYSSGMYVRLAFSVAAHMESDILLVDEVLAVGDADFQKKCLGKMEEITKENGRTIVFVSHNMSAIKNLCTRTIVLNKGEVSFVGDTEQAIIRYIDLHSRTKSEININNDESKPANITRVVMKDKEGKVNSEFPISEDFNIELSFTCNTQLTNATLSLVFFGEDGDTILFSSDADKSGELKSYEKGEYSCKISIAAFLFNVGKYYIKVILHQPNIITFAEVDELGFEITNINNPRSIIFQKKHPGKIAFQLDYKIKKD